MSFWSKFGTGLSKIASIAGSPIVSTAVSLLPGGGIATAAIHEVAVIDATAKQAQSDKDAGAMAVTAATGAIQTLENVVLAEGKTVPAELKADTDDFIKVAAPAFVAKAADLEARWHALL